MPIPLFHSLGSNYSAKCVELATHGWLHPTQDDDATLAKLSAAFAKKFKGEVLFVYKGRDAIELALRPIVDAELAHSTQSLKLGVLTQGLACHAIEEGIIRAGMIPVYADLETGTLGPSAKTLQRAMKRAEMDGITVKAVLIQHTLGYIQPLAEIDGLCRKHGLILIEDLAQSFGATEESGTRKGKEVGTRADVIVCSFGRDKVLDAVSGGAVIYKPKYWEKVRTSANWIKHHAPQSFPPLKYVRREMIYPWVTQLIRQTHQSGVGKLIYQLAKMLGVLTSPIVSPTSQPTGLPAAYGRLVAWQLTHLDEQLQHRRKIAAIYFQGLRKVKAVRVVGGSTAMIKAKSGDIHLRVPILFQTTEQMQKVIKALREEHIYLTDRWYRAVVDSGSLGYSTTYRSGTCPVAEQTAAVLFNLPTHQHVSVKDAQQIVRTIKNTLQSTR